MLGRALRADRQRLLQLQPEGVDGRRVGARGGGGGGSVMKKAHGGGPSISSTARPHALFFSNSLRVLLAGRRQCGTHIRAIKKRLTQVGGAGMLGNIVNDAGRLLPQG